MQRVNRRHMLRLGAAIGLGLARPTRSAARPAKPRIAFIGVGDRGTGLLRLLLATADADMPAVCDINGRNLNRALGLVEQARGRRPEGYSKDDFDYRRMLARTDFDAVLIATPQELHARMAADAMLSLKGGSRPVEIPDFRNARPA